MATIIILSGEGRYADPWHPFAETSAAITRILTERGHRVETRPTVPESFDTLDADLLVANVGGGEPGVELAPDPDWVQAFERLGACLETTPLLAVHTSANGFRDWPRWHQLLGGAWLPGIAHHPEIGVATFEPVPGAEEHPIWAGQSSVTCFDERYSDFTIAASTTPLVRHVTDGRSQTMGWAHGTRVVYDGLGHDARSYSSPDRARLLVAEVDWLLAQRP